LLKNTRSGGIGQGRVSAAAAGGAKRRAFTEAGAEGTARKREKGSPSLDSLFSIGYRTATFCFHVETKIRELSWILLFSRLFSYG
jgi:hypothetical protein